MSTQDMKFKTQDKEYLAELKKCVVENSVSPLAWNLVYNQLYIDDIGDYLRNISTESVSMGSGNYLPKILIITQDSNEAQLVKLTMRELGMNPEDVWVTPLIKASDISLAILTTYLLVEIGRLSPTVIVNLSNELLFNQLKTVCLNVYEGALNEAKMLIQQASDCCKKV